MVKPVSVTVREAIESDYVAISSIYNQAIEAGGSTFHEQLVSADYFRTGGAKKRDRESLLVIEGSGQVLGWGSVKQYSDRSGYRFCCETSIYLDAAARGQGHGSLLQKALLDKAAALEYHHIVLKIVASNQSSIRFHERFGFELVGIQKEIGFTHGRWHDVAIMQLLLPS
ncbi:MAG: GNAT family N-acetyltransferase [Thermosynechococcaceae cyanobacterium]